ncbi:MAG: type II toxin-antitoxin system HicB family antitoxin [Armatimonadota bacterium]|jgi:predicted RNase H-like HicB family nuclease
MTTTFTAAVWQEEDLFVAQCLEVDVVSQGTTEEAALANLREALELYLEEPTESPQPKLVKVEVHAGAA